MIAQSLTAPAGLDSDQAHALVLYELVKRPNRVGTTAHTRDDSGREFPLSFQDLRSRLASNHAMKVAHHRGIGMSPKHAAQQIMCRAHVRDPVAHGLIDSVFQCP